MPHCWRLICYSVKTLISTDDTNIVANKGIPNIIEHFLKVVLEEKMLAGNKHQHVSFLFWYKKIKPGHEILYLCKQARLRDAPLMDFFNVHNGVSLTVIHRFR